MDTVGWSISSAGFCVDYSSESFVAAVAYRACSAGSVDALYIHYFNTTDWSL